MSELSAATFKPGTLPSVYSNYVNQKTYTISGTHTAAIQTITTSATISGITAPQYLVNTNTGEVIYAEGVSGATFTSCTRGADGTTAVAMATGEILRPVIAANIMNQLVRELLAMAVYVYNADPTVIRQIAAQEAIRFQRSDGQIDHKNIQNVGTNIHTVIDAFIAQKAAVSGLASLDGSSLVVQNPANATATATASKLPISGTSGKLDLNWVNSADLILFGRVFN